jgi:O-antigen/teichoic acid export membrane protein
MALSLSFGILFASTITLVLIPCLYLVVETNHRFISALLLLLLLIAASFLMAFVGLFSLGVGTTISVLLLVIMIGLAVRKALGHFPETQAPV